MPTCSSNWRTRTIARRARLVDSSSHAMAATCSGLCSLNGDQSIKTREMKEQKGANRLTTSGPPKLRGAGPTRADVYCPAHSIKGIKSSSTRPCRTQIPRLVACDHWRKQGLENGQIAERAHVLLALNAIAIRRLDVVRRE